MTRAYKGRGKPKRDITGESFGRLTIQRFSCITEQHQNRRALWLCICSCGKTIEVSTTNLKNGNTKSCGCLQKEMAAKYHFKHGFGRSDAHGGQHPLYTKWKGIMRRCYNFNDPAYLRYGGRGITVSKRWLESKNFIEDMLPTFEAHVRQFGQRETTIDRINNNLGYSFKNCRWATWKEQGKNRSRSGPLPKIKV